MTLVIWWWIYDEVIRRILHTNPFPYVLSYFNAVTVKEGRRVEGREEVALRASSEVWINHTIIGYLQNSSNDLYINI